jgi:hypothetical protein
MGCSTGLGRLHVGAGRATRLIAFVLALTAISCARAQAEDRAGLLRLLRDDSSFRVRARAALALGLGGDLRIVGALEAALRDPHPAVRAAAARSLGQVGTRRSVPPLRMAAADPTVSVASQAKNALRMIAGRELAREPAQPEPRVAAARRPPALAGTRYLVVLGDMRTRTPLAGVDLPVLLGEHVSEALAALRHVAVFAPAELTAARVSEARRRRIAAFRIEGTIDCVDGGVTAGEHRMRCQVSLLLMDEPGRTLRSAMRGAASGIEAARGARDQQLRLLARKTLRGAVRSAMAPALSAIEAASLPRALGPDSAAVARADSGANGVLLAASRSRAPNRLKP